ncbi:MAG TPA: ERCC4 domain-containing protein [candidate division Zixibacteria bacterium]
MKHITIAVDHLRESSEVTARLRERGATITLDNLPVGDFRVSTRCTVLCVSAVDLARWTAEREIFRRITNLKKSVREPVVIVEGELPVNGGSPSRSAMRGALAFVAVHNRVPVLFAEDAAATADWLYAMATQVQIGMGESVDAQVSATPPSGNGQGVPGDEELPPSDRILRLLPGIGDEHARALIEHFGNLRGIFSADVRELGKIGGIGPKRAKRIVAFLEGRDH